MLTPQQLEEFAEYMRSGELEKDFADGCEHDRYYLLEMLEGMTACVENGLKSE